MSSRHPADRDALALTEEQFNQLMALLRMYRRNAHRCVDARAYVAGCAAAGATMETALVILVHLASDELPSSYKFPHRRGQPKPLLDWNIEELLSAADVAGWLPRTTDFLRAFDAKNPGAGDFASQLRQLRNLIHPQRYMQDHAGRRVTRSMSEFAIEIEEYLSETLRDVIERRLARRMEEEE